MELFTIKQRFDAPTCGPVENAVIKGLRMIDRGRVGGGRMAIAVGSRGIAGLDRIVRATVAWVKESGGVPFIVPAMGSHGSATAEGQAAVLAEYGITAQRVGAPVVSSMEVAEIGTSRLGNRVVMDRAAYEADGVLLVNRIKPHTDFHGRYESGLVKMGVIGLGNHEAAMELHGYGVAGLRDHVPASFEVITATGKIVAGIAIIENAYDEVAAIEVCAGADILKREPGLLSMARSNMPSLPVEDIDVLVVDRLGKDISGTGMDPNIIGRIRIPGQQEPARPRIRHIVVTDLTPASHGNALGIGLADVITQRLFDRIDFESMRVNVRTSLFLERIKVPFIAASDADAVALALRACGRIEQGTERIVRIRDTLTLGKVQVSGTVLEEIRDSVEVVGGPEEMLSEKGTLREF
ncbi:MAG: DUF2088 domain-containing protein [Chitinispirillaceae bacterium]|nr:DUF2088 domain-containing protein [Chitinispirillaceae bacterium]